MVNPAIKRTYIQRDQNVQEGILFYIFKIILKGIYKH